MACLDTTALLDLGKKPDHPVFVALKGLLVSLAAQGHQLVTTRFNVAELYMGLELARDRRKEHERIQMVMQETVILEFDEPAAEMYGRVAAALRRQGSPIGDFDTLTASVAMSRGQSIVTRNAKHFRRIPSLVVNPYAEPFQ